MRFLIEQLSNDTKSIKNKIISKFRKLNYKINETNNGQRFNIIASETGKEALPNDKTNNGICFQISDSLIRFKTLNIKDDDRKQSKGLELIKTILDEVPKDWYLEICIDDSKGFWDHIIKKYFSDRKWIGSANQTNELLPGWNKNKTSDNIDKWWEGEDK